MDPNVEGANLVLKREGFPFRLEPIGSVAQASAEDGMSVCIADAHDAERFQRFKTKMYQPDLGASLPRLPLFEADAFVFAPRITPSWAEYFRRHGVMYLDERGNCFIDKAGCLLYTSDAADDTR